MVKFVIKRGGKKEAFRPGKLQGALRAACKEAHLPAKRVKTVVNRVYRGVVKSLGKRQAVKSAIVRKKALAKLAKLEPMAAKAWRKYDKRRMARRRRR